MVYFDAFLKHANVVTIKIPHLTTLALNETTPKFTHYSSTPEIPQVTTSKGNRWTRGWVRGEPWLFRDHRKDAVPKPEVVLIYTILL